jgi:peptidoglycan-N-acetylglucosamine deacetylase
MYKKNPQDNSSGSKLLKFLGAAVAAFAAAVGIYLGSQFLNTSTVETLANLGVSDAITNNQKIIAKQPIDFESPVLFQGKTLKSVVVPDGQKPINLTFDDGPWPQTTEAILDTLKKEKVRATFFMIGQPLRSFPEIAKKVVADGHEIANHTVHHWYHNMGATVAQREIDDTNKIILETLNVKTSYFRPPGGVLTNGLAAYAHKLNDAVLMWSVDSGDSQPKRPSVETIVKNVVSQATPGGIVLMHDGGGKHENTAKAVPEIIKQLRAQGYTFVTTTELLEIGKPTDDTNKAKSDQTKSDKKAADAKTPTKTKAPANGEKGAGAG